MRIVTVSATALAVGLLVVACGGGADRGGGTPAASSGSTSSTSPTPVPPVTEADLDGLLLTPAEVGAAVGVTDMTVVATSGELAEDITVPPGAPKEKAACVGVAGTAEAQAYADSGATAVRDQLLRNGPELTAGQSLVVFASAGQASEFLGASAERWPACREFTVGGVVSMVGPFANINGTLSTSFTRGTTVCRRALTVVNNVAVEASTCGAAGPESAMKIASQLAGKIAK